MTEKVYNVDECFYKLHVKRSNGSRSLKVDYQCGVARISDWVCFEHKGFALTKAEQWWSRRMPGKECPTTIEGALEQVQYIPIPKKITVMPEGKYTKITQVYF